MPILGAKGGASESSYRGELDDIPGIIGFSSVVDADPGVTYTSGIATISGLNYRSKVSIVGTGASFSINGSPFISTVGYVKNGDTVNLSVTPPRTFTPSDFNNVVTPLLKIGKSSTTWRVTTKAIDETPDAFTFTNVTDAPLTSDVLSDPITISGLETNNFSLAEIVSSVGLIRRNGAAGVRTTNIFNGDEVILIRPALTDTPSNYNSPTSVSVSVGAYTTSWAVTTVSPDLVPNQFAFTGISSVGIASIVTSNTITVQGINSTATPKYAVPISIGSTNNAGFSYAINGGSYQAGIGSVSNGDTVSLRAIAAVTYSTPIVGVVTIGGISTSWTVTTRIPPVNSVPNQFTFNDIGTNQDLNTQVFSNSVTLTGMDVGQTAIAFIAAGSGVFRVTRNNVVFRDYSAAAIQVQNNDVITLRLTSSVNYGQTVSTTFSVTGVNVNEQQQTRSDVWSVTNVASPSAPLVNFSAGASAYDELLNIEIPVGATTTLFWDVTGSVTSVSINQGIGAVANSGSINVSPSTTTVYTLTAVGPGGTVSQNITVSIPPAPVINTFVASPNITPIGGTITLSWDISNQVTQASIDQGVGNIAASGFAQTTLTQDRTFALTASGPGGITTARVQAAVIPLPIINFTSDKSTISAGESANLIWTVTPADTVFIDNGIGFVPTGDARLVSPNTTTTYTLTATNVSGTKTATRRITVVPLPVINSLTASPSSIDQGETTTISWNTTNASTVTFKGNSVALDGSLTFSPSSNTTYTITASNSLGDSVSRSVSVSVTPAPSASLTVSPDAINQTQSTRISWNCVNVTSVNITNIGSVGLTGSVTRSPRQNTVYTLTATKPDGGVISISKAVTYVCDNDASSLDYRYGLNSCGTCSNGCFGTYWLSNEGNNAYYGNITFMTGNVRSVNQVFFTELNRYCRSSEIDAEVDIFVSLGQNTMSYSQNVRSRKTRLTTSPRSVCGSIFTDLKPNIYCKP